MTTTTTLLWVLVSFRLALAQPAGPVVLAATLPQATMSALQASDGEVGASAFPGGMVWQGEGKVVSVAMGLAPKGHPQAEQMAKRAAYLVAVRNAGLYLGGWQCDADGRLRQGRRIVRAELHVKNFREVSSTWDPRTQTATATVEVRVGKVRR